MCSSFDVHHARGDGGLPRRLRWLRLIAVTGAAAAALAACGGAASVGGGPPDTELAQHAVERTRPAERLHVIFAWDLRDRDARFNGNGVLRLDQGYRARVDLFGPRGETLSAAIIEGERMRVAPAGTESLLPPPALLWSALGVFRPPTDAPLVATTHRDGRVVLDYVREDARWRFRFENDLLRGTEWTAHGGRRTVELSGAAAFGLPAQAAFRDWTEFRELTLRVTDVEQSPAFGAEVWILPGQ